MKIKFNFVETRLEKIKIYNICNSRVAFLLLDIMKVQLLILALFYAMFACQTKQDNQGLIPKDKMARILIRIHLAEAKSNFYQFKTIDSSKIMFSNYKDELLKKEGVSPIAFDSSYNYYSRNVNDFNQIYTMVIDSLTIREAMNKID